jgi:hypothetical protein
MNAIQNKARHRPSIQVNENINFNLNDLLFTKDKKLKKSRIINKLEAKEEDLKYRMSICTPNNMATSKSYRISALKLKSNRSVRKVANVPPCGIIEMVKSRRRSFDKIQLRAKHRISEFRPSRNTDRAISDEIDYLKNEVIDRLVGIS